MNTKEILHELARLAALDRIEVTPLLPDSGFTSPYAPINTYLNELQRGSKPETASEGLFRALAADILDLAVIPQVSVGNGFVDFVLDAVEESSIVIELKPLFHIHTGDALKSEALKPASYIKQIEKYLQRAEYVVLTDLRDAYLYSARDVWQPLQPFAKRPLCDLLENARTTASLQDVLREAEDGEARPDLDRSFFDQLQEWFRAFEPLRFVNEAEHDELVIVLINQIIFAKTMEDHSLVRYRFLQDKWHKAKDDWEAKGPRRIVEQFLHDFERFFEDYYDTELFERSIWKELDKEPKNLERFCRLLEAVLGLDKWSQTFKRGIVHYNYRLINEDIFGKSYEMFLAANRKDEGIYYTPATITTPMADSLVDSLFDPLVTPLCAAVGSARCDFATAEQLMTKLTRLTIADTAAGSGGFLIKVLRAVWRQYQRIDEACSWVEKLRHGDLLDLPPNVQQAGDFRKRHRFDARRELVARILLRHIFAVDKDAGAIEVAKTNLWKEAVKLSREDYNFRRLTGDIQRTLPSLRLNFVCADSLVDTDPTEQVRYLSEVCGQAMQKLCAWREQYIANPSDHAPLDEALKLAAKLRENLTEHFQGLSLPAPALFAALSFCPAWFEQNGRPRPASERGFDGVIGNPPWEGFKPVKKEFARVRKYSMDAAQFEQWFTKKLKEDAEFRSKWEEYESGYAAYKEFFGRQFQHQGTGDWNLFKLFIESDVKLVRDGGGLSLLVPSSIQTDEGCADLRRLLAMENTLNELTSFENRGYKAKTPQGEEPRQIFPDVDSRFKFGFFKVVKGVRPAPDHTLDARFYLHDPADVFSPPIKYSAAMIERFSPQNYSFMEFRSAADYALCSKIRGEHRLLQECGHQFRRELHPADDAESYLKEPGRKLTAGELPIYEGKMIYQFDAHFAPRNFHAVEKTVRAELFKRELHRLGQFIRDSGAKTLEGKALPRKKEDFDARMEDVFKAKKFKLHCDFERLGYRRIGRSTDERTIIATLLPERIFLSDTVSYLTPANYKIGKGGKLVQEPVPADEVRALLCLLNSQVLNYYIRNKISATVNMFYVYELPIPELKPASRKRLATAADKLLKKPNDVAARSALEVFIARDLYGLSLDDWKHLTGTFTYGGDSATKAELDEIIRRSHALWAV